jgi:antitoxin CcdA
MDGRTKKDDPKMIHTTKFRETIENEQVEAVTCDVCGKRYANYGNTIFEVQEFHHINFVGGYGSVFGDEAHVRCDICQHCLRTMIGPFFQTGDSQ